MSEEGGAPLPKRRLRIGELLVEAGVITTDDLRQALAEQRRSGKRIGSVLIERGCLTEQGLVKALAAQCNLPVGDLDRTRVPKRLLKHFPPSFMAKHGVFPVAVVEENNQVHLWLACADPTNIGLLDKVSLAFGALPVKALVVPETAIDRAVERHFTAEGEYREDRAAPPIAPPAPPKVMTYEELEAATGGGVALPTPRAFAAADMFADEVLSPVDVSLAVSVDSLLGLDLGPPPPNPFEGVSPDGPPTISISDQEPLDVDEVAAEAAAPESPAGEPDPVEDAFFAAEVRPDPRPMVALPGSLSEEPPLLVGVAVVDEPLAVEGDPEAVRPSAAVSPIAAATSSAARSAPTAAPAVAAPPPARGPIALTINDDDDDEAASAPVPTVSGDDMMRRLRNVARN